MFIKIILAIKISLFLWLEQLNSKTPTAPEVFLLINLLVVHVTNYYFMLINLIFFILYEKVLLFKVLF